MSTRASGGGSGKDGLLKDLRKQVSVLEDDLRARSDSVNVYRERLSAEYGRAYEARRTAATYEAWRDERVTQVAAAWVLGCVFVRFCEDNGLIARPWLAGVGERLKDAEDHDSAFFAANPEKNDRDWIIAAFDHLAGTNPTVAGLFDRAHNPMWEIEPSYEAATGLLKFWRRVGADSEIVHKFVDEDLDTRFLGDLYQDLSEHARKTYALLQTPVFVEEFILDLTLEPAVAEFGLVPVVEIRDGHGEIRELPAGLRTIDPACGSGHFLLGMFERLLEKWRDADKIADEWTLIRRALASVHGCDKNPFAVAIARFRLLVAVLKAAEEAPERRLLDALGEFPINIAVGDSLLHGRGAPKRESEDLFSSQEVFHYRTEDIEDYAQRCDLLTRDTYHVVVGNPPYIPVEDEQENENYRAAYETCSGSYHLSVPFAQRIFQLATRSSGSDRRAGFTGQITANGFMKRDFGKKLIPWFHQTVDLTHVIDTAGAHIPGHGTPTVILIGRNRIAYQGDSTRVALGIQDEPGQPDDAAEGFVWSAIKAQIGDLSSESPWIGVEDFPRSRLADHPWSLAGGGAADLVARLNTIRANLKIQTDAIGRTTDAGEEAAWILPDPQTAQRLGEQQYVKTLVSGEFVRDFLAISPTLIRVPYADSAQKTPVNKGHWLPTRPLWIYRTRLNLDLA